MAAAASQQQPLPLFDLFLDIPHPDASPLSAQQPILKVIGAANLSPELEQNIPQVSRFAFPEYLETTKSTANENDSKAANSSELPLNRWDYYGMQNSPFSSFTFTLQLGDGSRLHGHVRRYLPLRYVRYDVGRRGERAAVLLTRCSGADLVFAGMLK